MKKLSLKNTGDTVGYICRFDPRQVPYVSTTETDADFSHSDGANLETIVPKKVSRPKVKMVVENSKPEL